MRESKDKIKSRMLRNAARIWGFQEPQPESSFDPLVGLLLGACAFELEKISSEINNAESRIIERMVNILTPHPITGVQPAYAVAYAKPNRQNPKVSSEDQFFTEKKVSDLSGKKTNDKQIFFSPTGTFGLTNGCVRYVAGHKRIYEMVNDQYKDIVIDKCRAPLPGNRIYLGLELNERPAEIAFYFDMISEPLKQAFFTDLESCRWIIGGIQLNARKGLRNFDKAEQDIYQLINRQIDQGSKISDHVNAYFNRQFVTLLMQDVYSVPETDLQRIPDVFATSIDEKELANLDENIIWIELRFLKHISEDILENLICSLNCFPVINRRLNEYTAGTREYLNIIPLNTDDVFFDLKSVINSNGEAYRINYFDGQGDIPKGSAIFRAEGVGRFDSRNAMEYLDYVLDLMKEESAAFNIIGSDMIASNLKELKQAIARLEKKLEDVRLEKGDTAYLMLRPKDSDRHVFVEFWSTNCSEANHIRAGNPLNVYRADDIEYNSAKLMTNTMGGKEKPNTQARINTIRRMLQSGNRVVTIEDIKALCFEYFGDHLSEVHVEKGIEKGIRKTEGFIRTIDIHLLVKNDKSIEEQNAIRQELLVLLEARSSNAFPFRVFFGIGNG